MRTATLTIRSLIDRIDRGEIRLPEIQRAYVWKPPAIAGLVESLYRRYPSGSLLMWEADKAIQERDVAIGDSPQKPLVQPLYLLDGQQRLTSLHRVYEQHQNANVVFNVESQAFQIQSAATAKDPKWVVVHSVLNEAEDTYDIVERIQEQVGLARKTIHDRLEQLRKINEYTYYVEILEELPYEEVTEIFVRVNSRGRPLRATDLALATLSARWPGTVKRVEEQVAVCASNGYGALDETFHTRCLAALVSDTASPKDFRTADLNSLADAWERTKRGVKHLIKLLQGHLRADSGDLLPSVNALVPLVAFLGLREDKALDHDTTNALMYWLLGAWIHARFSGSTQTAIAQDVAAVRSPDALQRLYQNLGLLGHRLVVTEAQLVGRGSTSPYFFLSYACVRKKEAHDWWHDVHVGALHDEGYKVEYHHIHPRATLKDSYGKSEINDLANLAFISAKANKKISDRSPSVYFPEVGPKELDLHLIPLDEHLRTAANYPAFISARRIRLSAEMTSFLESFRPAFLDEDAQPSIDSSAGDAVIIDAYGSSPFALDVVFTVLARTAQSSWQAALPLESLRRVLEDIADSRGSELSFGNETTEFPIGIDEISLPVGPLLVRGSLDEWYKVIDRELGDLRPLGDLPDIEVPPLWTGERVNFPVLDTE